MVLGPLSGTPFKVYAVQAAAGGVGFPAFLGASIPARMPRFLIVTIVAGCVARLLRRRLSLRAVYGIWLVLWMAFYAVYFSHMPG